MMKYLELERPFAIQIFGYDIDRMRDAALMCQDAGVDLVDINCGCPAPKVVRRGGGCELMRQPDHLAKIIREVRRALTIPLTIKIRAGWDESSKNALEVAKMAESEGVDALAIHGRTRAALYRGEADWGIVREVANTLKIPVMGSGDVVDRKTAEERISGGVSGLFIGRASYLNPFIFSEIVHNKKTVVTPELAMSVLERYIELLLEDFPPKACIGKLKQIATGLLKGMPYRKPFLTVHTLKEQQEMIQRIKEGSFTVAAPPPQALEVCGLEG